MKIVGKFKIVAWSALILYVMRTILMSLVTFPLFVFISGKFGSSLLADKFWPLPHGAALVELVWQLRDLLYYVIPLFLMMLVLAFFLTQFLYGGIYETLWRNDIKPGKEFFAFCGRRFYGFVKITSVGIPAYLVVLLAADLVALVFGKLVGAIAGQSVGRYMTYMILFAALYLLSAYLINLRYIQTSDNNSSLRNAFKRGRVIFAGKLRFFIGLNVVAGVFTFVSFSVAMLLIGLPYRFTYSPAAVIFLVLLQQIVIFWFSLMEVFQIQVNGRFIREMDYGAQME